jgi:hypothetical protein
VRTIILLVTAWLLATTALAQEHVASKVDVSFNRYYDYHEIASLLEEFARAYPDLVTLESLGKSEQGRDMWLVIVNPRQGLPHSEKPAMFIDGNIHGNEIQAAEVVLYTLWYLTKSYGHVDSLTTLMDRCAFYLVPVQNPDSRAWWFSKIASPHSPRGNQRPLDDDGDGLIDEDGPDDLDGDGSITQMWVRDPDGEWIRDRWDDRIFQRVPQGERGEWTRLGQEGIDNDGDGRVNEDDTTAEDMNRNWPGDWKPTYVQNGAGPYPLSSPETRAIANFVAAHPNIGGYQSYHNAGGMMLRGPGAAYRDGFYSRGDASVYEEIGRLGEQILPYYRYLVIHRDLYTVHGGEVNWAAESLGIVSFTNELWTADKYFQRDGGADEDRMWVWRDRLDFGQTFTPYTEVDHPQHGRVLVGGMNKWSSRNTPTFMLEEECHRNFAFTVFHAEQLPQLKFGALTLDQLDDRLWEVTVSIENEMSIPTRLELMARRGIGESDRLEVELPAGASVVTSGSVRSRRDRQMDEVRFEPGRVRMDRGVPGKGQVLHRFFIEADAGTRMKLRYTSPRAVDIEREVLLELVR